MTHSVLKVDDILNPGWRARFGADASAPMFAVLGKPIGHSKSPLIQNAALAALPKLGCAHAERFAGSEYFAFEVAPENLGGALKIFGDRGFMGLNLTIPHKEVVLPFVSQFDESARLAGACNTLQFTESGWKGFNTDGYGLEKAAAEGLGAKLGGADVVIIGAGGAARGAAFHIAFASKARSIVLANRSRDRLEKLRRDLDAAGFECGAYALDDERLYSAIRPGSVIVNATSVGLGLADKPVLDFSKVDQSCAFFDMPYAFGRQTASVGAALARGLRACGGLGMLAWQGAKSLSIWTGCDVELAGRAMCGALLGTPTEEGRAK